MTKEKASSDEQNLQRQIARAIARKVWTIDFKEANPKASTDEMNAAWNVVRQGKIKSVQRALKSLAKEGYSISAPKT